MEKKRTLVTHSGEVKTEIGEISEQVMELRRSL